jgi:hypothetical protein
LRVLRIDDDFDDVLGTERSEVVVLVLFGGVGPGLTAEAGFEAVPCMGTMPCSRAAAAASRPSILRPGFPDGDVCVVIDLVVAVCLVAVRESVFGLRNLE